MTLKEIGKEMVKYRNLSTIIEKKKEEFEKDYKKQIESELGELAVSGIKYFLEKAIRESVEEALRWVKPVAGYNDSFGAYYYEGELEERIKEFMK